ncbi:ABC transporter ATP-binding protein/permease [Pseudazoarcus pumilus]|uniref:Thiol reductant ABC exporter subunit CydD n=1 Tax=Pseudazoarcus pumilus TaxID=2067960 RepID=A0A2I6S7K0_9RHOO|nr:ATP-binding cassette domain-containing protein [Pseudazoarcus pumilus]AUN95227.1 thiol reductant ABC exporter subunit CydD [Pseudazoarcus pumilus]
MPATDITERARLAQLLGPAGRGQQAGRAASVAVGLAVVAQAAAIALAIDATVFRGEFPAGWIWLLAIGAVMLRFACAVVRETVALCAARAVRDDVRERLRRRMDALGPHALAREGGAAWAARYHNDVDALSAWPARYAPARDAACIVPPLVLFAAASQDVFAAFLLAASAPLILAFMVLTGLRSARVHARQQHEQGRMEAHFLDRLRALDLIRRSGALQRSAREVFAAADRYRQMSMRVLRVAFLSSAVMELFSAIAIGLVAIHVGFALLGGGDTPGITPFAGLFVLLLAPEFFAPLRAFAQGWHDRAGALSAARALATAIDGMRVAPAAAPPAPRGDALLVADALSVSPAADAPSVVEAVALRVSSGEIVVLTGASGAGKSTLLAVCAGFIAPRAGRLERVADIAWLAQAGHLFHGTLRDNLRLAAPDADDARLGEALAAAGLAVDDSALPDGLDTAIGEGRRGLSGGQAQRVALARAWLSGARLWLLDEPTRGLDDETAEALWSSLMTMARERGAGLLVATHDVRAIARAGRVLHLANARLEEVVDAPV